MSTLTYPEAMFVGLLQGVTELFPVSSLGHSVLIPAIIGGSWAQDLNVSRSESPYLAFIVGLHVATAAAMILYFWRDWARIIGGFLTSVRYRRVATANERLAWMIILATIPVGVSGLLLEHIFRVYFSKPVPTALFLTANGIILLWSERRRKAREVAATAATATAATATAATATAATATAPLATVAMTTAAAAPPPRRPGQAPWDAEEPPRLPEHRKVDQAVAADQRLSAMGFRRAAGIGTAQVLALLPGISRDGIVTVVAMSRGLSRQDAVRYSFLLSAPVILAAGALKIKDLFGPLGAGIHGQVLVGSILSFIGAYFSVWFLTRYFGEAKSLRPFGLYCLAAGLFSLIFVLAFR